MLAPIRLRSILAGALLVPLGALLATAMATSRQGDDVGLRDASLDPLVIARPSLQVFDDSAGLPQNSVMAIALDARRYLWIATQAGAAYYNGRA